MSVLNANIRPLSLCGESPKLHKSYFRGCCELVRTNTILTKEDWKKKRGYPRDRAGSGLSFKHNILS